MRPIVVLTFLLALLAGSLPVCAADDPSELFLNAYLAVQQGQKLERNGENAAALAKLRYAANLLQQVSQSDPEWQPLIVDYRRQKTAEAIRRVEDKIEIEGPGEAPPTPTDIDEPLPARDLPTPSVSVQPDGGPSVDTLELATSQIRDRMQRLERELADSRREVATLRRDKQSLTSTLEEAQQRAQQAEVNEAEVKSRLTQAQATLDNMKADKTSDAEGLARLAEQVDKLSTALQTARVERDAADELAGNLAEQRKELRATLTNVEARLEQALAADDTAEVRKLEGQIAELKQALATTRAERDAADEFASSLRAKLATERTQASQRIAAVTAERDEAVASMEAMKQSQAQMEKLVAENEALSGQLEEARQSIAAFDASTLTDKDQEIARLKDDILATKAQLTEAQNESAEYRTVMVELQSQLDALRRDSDAGLTQENEMLRGIVLRQLKEQARRDQAKKLVMAELGKLEVQSDTLLKQIDYLGSPVTELTPEEKSLFKDPQIEILDLETPSAMAVEIAAPKEDDDTAAEETDTEVGVSEPSEMASPGETTLPESPFDAPLPESDEEPATPQVKTSSQPNVPGNLLPIATQAREQFQRGDFREAEKLYEKILAEAPNNLYALSNLGVSRYRGGKLRLAEEAFKKAVAIDPNDAFSHRTLGIVYYSQGRYDDAIDALTKSLAVNTKDPIAHNYLGIAASQKGWPEAAQKEMETAVALDPNYADAHFNLAVIHISARPPRKEKAREHYERAVELGSPADPALEEMLK